MSNKSDRARLEFIILLIKDIEIITARHDGVEKALEDVEGRYALLMCCQQIGETLSKLENNSLKERLPVQAAYSMRNIIAHDYLGINSKIVAKIISDDIPELQSKY
jgi:uncharacterized protein with HEPN domain